MINKNLTVIGVGNMGWAVVQRLLEANIIAKDNLLLSDPAFRQRLQEKFDLHFTDDNTQAAKDADIILLAVKPQHLADLLQTIQPHLKKNVLLISIAAGFAITTIKTHVGQSVAVVRVMPNLCATVGESMSAWIKSSEVTADNINDVRQILQAIGKEVEVDDEQAIDAFTAVAGSGPAYVFYLAQLLEEAAHELGFRSDAAKTIALQTLKGSTKLLVESTFDAVTLRQHVTSKGGTTEAAFKEFDKQHVGEGVKKGIQAAFRRAQELGK